MASLLVAIMYLAFISLGLPDALPGSSWPVVHLEMNADVEFVGYIAMTIAVFTVISSLFADRITVKFGTGIVTACSVLLTAAALLSYSFAKSPIQLILVSIPYGLGAGSIDAALNNYVALHFSSKHMNWLHCSWGIGAMLGPYVLSFALTESFGWRGGYRAVSVIQFTIGAVLILALPLWKKFAEKNNNNSASEDEVIHLPIIKCFKLEGAKYIFGAFFCYCAFETLPMTWCGSYYSEVYGLTAEKAAFYSSMFYTGMTVSRALCGFISNKFGDKKMIRLGLSLVLFSGLIVTIPFKSHIPALVGFLIMGFGCGPVYPSIVHSTPENFGRKYSGSIVGVQMAFAYIGYTVSPLIFGRISEIVSIKTLPVCIIILAVLCFVLIEIMNSIKKARNCENSEAY